MTGMKRIDLTPRDFVRDGSRTGTAIKISLVFFFLNYN